MCVCCTPSYQKSQVDCGVLRVRAACASSFSLLERPPISPIQETPNWWLCKACYVTSFVLSRSESIDFPCNTRAGPLSHRFMLIGEYHHSHSLSPDPVTGRVIMALVVATGKGEIIDIPMYAYGKRRQYCLYRAREGERERLNWINRILTTQPSHGEVDVVRTHTQIYPFSRTPKKAFFQTPVSWLKRRHRRPNYGPFSRMLRCCGRRQILLLRSLSFPPLPFSLVSQARIRKLRLSRGGLEREKKATLSLFPQHTTDA